MDDMTILIAKTVIECLGFVGMMAALLLLGKHIADEHFGEGYYEDDTMR